MHLILLYRLLAESNIRPRLSVRLGQVIIVLINVEKHLKITVKKSPAKRKMLLKCPVKWLTCTPQCYNVAIFTGTEVHYLGFSPFVVNILFTVPCERKKKKSIVFIRITRINLQYL